MLQTETARYLIHDVVGQSIAETVLQMDLVAASEKAVYLSYGFVVRCIILHYTCH